jgi:glycosyltransferase involved in cell wall biosynthesis
MGSVAKGLLAAVALGTAAALRRQARRGAGAGRASRRRLWVYNHYTYTPEMPESIRHWELATILDGRGWETRLIASAFNHRRRRFDRPVSFRHPVHDAAEHGVAFTWVYTSPYDRNDWRRYLNMLTYFVAATVDGLRRSPGPDAVIGTSPHLLAGLAAWIVAKRHRAPFILELQDLWPDTLVDMGVTNPMVIQPLRVMERFLYRRADAVIALSEGIRDRVIERGVRPEDALLLPNATTETRGTMPVDRAAIRRRFGWDGKVVAIYAGSHGPANGLENVVDAALLQGGRHGIVFAFLGDGSEKPGLVARAEGAEHVVFLDPVPKADVHAILSGADIGLINLRWNRTFEGARPNKIFDYLGAGLPIVTTVPGEIWSIVGGAEAGLLAEPENPAALAEAVEELARDDALRGRLATNALARVASLPTRQDTALALERLLLRSLGEPVGGDPAEQPHPTTPARAHAPEHALQSNGVS